MRFHSICLIITLIFFICSCSSIPSADVDIISDQSELIDFLEGIVNSQDNFSVDVLSRKTFSPRTRQTKLMTHSFFLIHLSDGSYHTLSFTNANLKVYKFFDEGIWILNKVTDINSYKLFIEGKNIWNVDYLYTENITDEYEIINNIISSISKNAKYYYKDHLKDRPDSLNCNSALNETVAFKQYDSAISDAIAFNLN